MILVVLVTFVLTSNSIVAKEPPVINEDEMIVRGLFCIEYRAYEDSWKIFKNLYDTTGEGEYLFQEIISSLLGKIHITESIERLELFDRKHPNMLRVKRLLVSLYLTNQQINKAKNEASFLIAHSNEASDMDLVSRSYLYAGEPKKAVALLQHTYEKSNNKDILLRLVSVMDAYTNQRKRAIQLLETYQRTNTAPSRDIYFKLLTLYVKENDTNGILNVYLSFYKNDKNDKHFENIVNAYIVQKDIDGAIIFLEKNHARLKMLYQLYVYKRFFSKALKLAHKFYKENHNPRWLAEIAILTYEQVKDKNDQKIIGNIVKIFDKAMMQGVNDSVYLNYYGYMLINNNINIEKGIRILRDALSQQPDNTYYLDSLAWGYYKEGKCKKAYDLMRKVVKREGLKEPEIAQHWDAIQKCK
ncbi:MAG: hypothetical protein LGB54_00270 [Sulfurovum sp.]|nr:hypothetical protein [Sulfurovum sp.]